MSYSIPSSLNQRRPGNTKLNVKRVQEIKRLAAEGRGATEIGKLLSLPRTTVSNVLTGQRWGWVR